MGPVSYVIAIMGCADGGTSCQQVALAPQRYESAAQCEAATANVLAGSTDLDFPTLLARCQTAKTPAAMQRGPVRRPATPVREG